MKRTFVVPEDKEEYYEKFKKLVPEVSGKLVEFIVEFVDRHEALQAQMTEQIIYEGEHDLNTDIFIGKELRFYGVEIASGKDNDRDKFVVYLTKKGKFLVFWKGVDEKKVMHMKPKVHETFAELSGNIPSKILAQCSEYLSINSTVRTYEILDI